MPQPIYANNVAGLLAANIGPSDTAVLLGAGQGALFPALTGGNWYYVTLVHPTLGTIEIVKATAKAVDTLTVVRGQDGTSATSFTTGALVEMRPVAQTFRDADYHAAAGAANGLATLDGSGKLTASQIPDSVLTEAEATAAYVPLTQKGAANGVASLDGAGDVPDAQIPAGIARTSALAAYMPLTDRGAVNGVAPLAGGVIPAGYIPALAYLPTGGGTLTGPLTVNNWVQGASDLILGSQSGNAIYLRPHGVGNGTNQGILISSGLLQVVDVQSYSDKRRKKKIQKRFARPGLAHKLQLSSWLNRSDNTPGIGLIAQDVLPLAPEYVGEDPQGFYSLNYAGLALEIGLGHETRLRRLEAALHLGSPE